VTASAQDRDHEIERLLALGAGRVDIGQSGAESWTVLAGPGSPSRVQLELGWHPGKQFLLGLVGIAPGAADADVVQAVLAEHDQNG